MNTEAKNIPSNFPSVVKSFSAELDLLSRDVECLESLRAVKDVQRFYAQYAQLGLFEEMSHLFTNGGKLIWGQEIAHGREEIKQWLREHSGPVGRLPGALNMEMIDDPLVNLAPDGKTAKGRWRGFSFRGDGQGHTRIEGGLYENSYALEDGRWKLSELHYYPQCDGSYEEGWRNVDGQDLPIVPYHFTLDESGIPIPPPEEPVPVSGASPEELKKRIMLLNEADEVRNLYNAYGYYADRRMWDDVVDLFADDGLIEFEDRLYSGKSGIRQAMEELMGPAGLSQGVLNDRLFFDTIVRVLPSGREAVAMSTELAMIGEADKGTARWECNVISSRFVKDAQLWKLREIRFTPLMNADYSEGWARGGLNPGYPKRMPCMPGPNPATGKEVCPEKYPLAGECLPAGAAPGCPLTAEPDLKDLRRRYLRSLAWDGTENVSAAYGYYLDDWQWPSMAGVFARNGHKASPFAGYYFGRERIAGAAKASYGEPRDIETSKRAYIAIHWRTQPVINVSHDGRSALLRVRLFHQSTGVFDDPPGGLFRRTALLQTGMYPNDQAVLEDGIWRLWSLTIDEPYMTMPDWKGGWSAAKIPPPGGGIRPSRLLKLNPPDLLLSELGHRGEGFPGGTGTKIDWPGILPMWFHYKNPVSGRMPERFWPDCVPSEQRPEVSMTKHGYQMPPTGPSEDGIEINQTQCNPQA